MDKDKGKKKKTKTPSLPRTLLPARDHPECEELEREISRERDLSCATGKGGGCRVLFKRSAYQEVARS